MTTSDRRANDPTLDVNLRSWFAPANDSATDFPLQNLPFCSFLPGVSDVAEGDEPEIAGKLSARGGDDDDADPEENGLDAPPRIGMAIGDSVLDLDMLMHAGAFDDAMLDGERVDDDFLHDLHECLHHGGIQELVAFELEFPRFLREQAQAFLLDAPVGGQSARRLRQRALHKLADVRLTLPHTPLNYTDFYASIHHATNVGSMFRPDNPLLPNYKHVPIGYHGRASSIVASGADIRRPRGQSNTENAAAPTFGPSKRLDYELELGVIIGGGNPLGEPITMDKVGDYMFGLVLVNDWSARDLQAWEYQPLGPFLAKNFATSISPFIVTRDALEPFRIAGPERGPSDPQPLEYLRSADPWGFDIQLEVLLQSSKMREARIEPARLSRGNFKHMYWTFAQMIAHHTSNGCNLIPGDLLASGTISGPEADSRGCMLELSWQGNGPDGKPLPRKPIELPTGEKRTFLEDGDEVIMRAWCERPGFRRIGFGECRGLVLPANA